MTMKDEPNARRRRDSSSRDPSRDPARCRSRGPQKKRPLRKTQSTPTQKKTAMDPFVSTSTAVFSSSFSDFGSASMSDILPSSFHGAFLDDAFGFSSNHNSFPLPAKGHSKDSSKTEGRTATARRKLPRRSMSHGAGVAANKTKRHNAVISGEDPNKRVSLEDLHRERRRLSLLLGEEQFPADDVSAILGDFCSSASACDFPGVNLLDAASQSAKKKTEKISKKKKTKPQSKPAKTSTSTKKVSTSSAAKSQKSKSTSKDKEQTKKFHDMNNSSQASLSSGSVVSVASAATIAALEALEQSARAREKGELAKKLQDSRRRHLMQQLQPSEIMQQTTSNTAGTDTASQMTASTKSDAVASIHTQVPEKDALDFYLELYTSNNSNDNTSAAAKNKTTTSSSQSVSSSGTNNSKKKRQQKQQPPLPKQPRKQHLDLPPLRAFQPSTVTTSVNTPVNHRGSMGDESEMSLSLSDLQRSDRRRSGNSKEAGKGKIKSSNHSTATTVNLSQSSMASSSSLSSTSTTSRSKTICKSTVPKPVETTSLDQSIHETPYHVSSAGQIEQGEQHRLSSDNTTCLLDSLTLDTVPENQSEESSEAPSISMHSSSAGVNVIHHTGSLSIMASPQKRRKQAPQPSPSSPVASSQALVQEGRAALQTSAKPPKDKAKSKMKRSTDDDNHTANKDSRNPKQTTTTPQKKKSSVKGATKRTDKSVSSASSCSSKSSRGKDGANRRSGRHSSMTSKNQPPGRHQRRKSGASVTSSDTEIHPHSINKLSFGARRVDEMNTSLPGYHHKSDRNLKLSEPMTSGGIHRDSQSTGTGDRQTEDRPYQQYHYRKAHDKYSNANDGEVAYFQNVLLQRIDPGRLYKMLPGPGGTPPPFSDHGPSFYYYHDGYPLEAGPQSTHRFSGRPPCYTHPGELPSAASNRYNANAAFHHGKLRRRHSLGSGHSRDSVMHEINTAMDQEYKCSTCGHCGHVISRCDCSSHHHNLEPIVDINSSRRHTRATHFRETCLPSNKVKQVSLFDTFGIRYLDTESREKAAFRGRLDEEVHSRTLRSPGSVPLYHRPKGFEFNERLYPIRVERIDTKATDNQQHRGRTIVGCALSSQGSSENQKQGVRDMTSTQESNSEVDDGSLKYPPREFSFGSSSGRTLDVSCLDDAASFLSFAI